MARNGPREDLIRTFQSRNRRKPAKAPGIDQGFPKVPGGTLTYKPGKTSPVVNQTLYRSSATPPGERPNPHFIPGYGGVQAEKGARKIRAAQSMDNSVPRHHWATPQRAPYRPGEKFKRKPGGGARYRGPVVD